MSDEKQKRVHKPLGETQIMNRCNKLLERLPTKGEQKRVAEYLASKFGE